MLLELLDTVLVEFSELRITLNAPIEDYPYLIDSIVDPIGIDKWASKFIKNRALNRIEAYESI